MNIICIYQLCSDWMILLALILLNMLIYAFLHIRAIKLSTMASKNLWGLLLGWVRLNVVNVSWILFLWVPSIMHGILSRLRKVTLRSVSILLRLHLTVTVVVYIIIHRNKLIWITHSLPCYIWGERRRSWGSFKWISVAWRRRYSLLAIKLLVSCSILKYCIRWGRKFRLIELLLMLLLL